MEEIILTKKQACEVLSQDQVQQISNIPFAFAKRIIPSMGKTLVHGLTFNEVYEWVELYALSDSDEPKIYIVFNDGLITNKKTGAIIKLPPHLEKMLTE